MIILGEDYGEGASVIQERSYAYAMKSSMWLLDPRPDLPTIVRMVEQGFELSEASHAPVMMELRIRACHVTGEFTAKANRRAAYSGKNRIAGPPALRLWPARASAGHLLAGAAQGRGAAAGGAAIHPRAQAQRADRRRPRRGRHHRARRPHQRRAARARAARPRRSLRREPHSDLRAQRRLSAGAGGGARVLRRQARGAGGRGRLSRLHRAGDQRRAAPRRHPDPRARQGLPAAGRRIHLGAAAQRARRVPRRRRGRPASTPTRSRARAQRMLAHKAAAAGGGRRHPGAAAEFLHRLSRASGVQRHQADAARARADPHQRRHRLPFVRDLRAVQPRQFHPRLRHVARERGRGRSQSRPPPDRRHGRRRILAQRPDHRRRLEPVQQGRRRADRDAERLRLGDRPAIPAVEHGEPQRRRRPA